MDYLGTGVALVTPFNEEGKVDISALEKLVNHVIEGGVEYIVALGTTAEVATLNSEEKELVLNTIINTNKGRIPLVIGIGGNNTQAVVDQIKNSDLSAFSAILSVSPYYNRPTQEGIYQHYAAIAEASPIDVILYNVPGRTGSNISVETTLRLADDFDNIVAIKEAGSFEQAMTLIKEKPEGFHVISGDDATCMPLTLMGGSGVISVIGQALSVDTSVMIRAALYRDVNAANDLHFKILDMTNMIFEEGNPAGIKTLLKKLGICSDIVRLPLISASENLSERIEENFENLYL